MADPSALQQIGLSHSLIKWIISLQRATSPHRGRFIAEGLWAHDAVLAADCQVELFLFCPEAAYSDQARTRALQFAERAENAYRISERTLARICERDKPDGLFSVVQMPEWQPSDLILGPAALVVVADGIEIPGNLGTLLRTMDAVAADALIMVNRRTRITHPKVFRGSHGMSLTVPQVEFAEVAEAVNWLRQKQFSILLADTAAASDYRSVDYRGRVAIVVGSERYGISPDFYTPDARGVFLPMRGRADSLNVSVSASILLYAARAAQAAAAEEAATPPTG